MEAHLHTTWTDGRDDLPRYLDRAKEMGLTHVAVTEHADDRSAWYPDYIRQRSSMHRHADPVQLYFGAEVRLADAGGRLNMSAERLSQVDFVVGVLHRYPCPGGDISDPRRISKERAQELDFSLSMALVANPAFHVFGHPGGMYAAHFDTYDPVLMDRLLTCAVEHDKVVEINGSERYRAATRHVLAFCLQHDVMISIGSDAHSIAELGTVRDYLRLAVKELAS